jgi:hypothetical protein
MPSHWTDSLDIDTPAAKARFTSMRAMLDRIVEETARRGIEVAGRVPPRPPAIRCAQPCRNPTQLAGVRFRSEWLAEDSTVQRGLARWSGETRNRISRPHIGVSREGRGSDHAHLPYRWPLDSCWTPCRCLCNRCMATGRRHIPLDSSNASKGSCFPMRCLSAVLRMKPCLCLRALSNFAGSRVDRRLLAKPERGVVSLTPSRRAPIRVGATFVTRRQVDATVADTLGLTVAVLRRSDCAILNDAHED